MPLANDPIMSERSIRAFRHLEYQNPSIISDSIGRARMVQQLRIRGMRLDWKCPRSQRSRRSTVGLRDGKEVAIIIANSINNNIDIDSSFLRRNISDDSKDSGCENNYGSKF